MSLGTWLESKLGLESKSSDLDVFKPGESATATFPKLKSWTPADTFVVPENLCFSTYYGDRFVWQQNQGVKLYVAMAFSFDTAQAYQEFTAKASVGLEGTFMKNYCENGCIKQLPIPFSADLEAQLTKISTQTTKNGKLSITFYQEGGEPQKTAGKAAMPLS